jgi:hypothetical protein
MREAAQLSGTRLIDKACRQISTIGASRMPARELQSPYPDFRVLAFRVYGRHLFEAYRVAGEGFLYSVTTTDLAELHAVLRDACEPDAGNQDRAIPEGG